VSYFIISKILRNNNFAELTSIIKTIFLQWEKLNRNPRVFWHRVENKVSSRIKVKVFDFNFSLKQINYLKNNYEVFLRLLSTLKKKLDIKIIYWQYSRIDVVANMVLKKHIYILKNVFKKKD
jgi:hypothetical protein